MHWRCPRETPGAPCNNTHLFLLLGGCFLGCRICFLLGLWWHDLKLKRDWKGRLERDVETRCKLCDGCRRSRRSSDEHERTYCGGSFPKNVKCTCLSTAICIACMMLISSLLWANTRMHRHGCLSLYSHKHDWCRYGNDWFGMHQSRECRQEVLQKEKTRRAADWHFGACLPHFATIVPQTLMSTTRIDGTRVVL